MLRRICTSVLFRSYTHSPLGNVSTPGSELSLGRKKLVTEERTFDREIQDKFFLNNWLLRGLKLTYQIREFGKFLFNKPNT